jgi:hypothetical protein
MNKNIESISLVEEPQMTLWDTEELKTFNNDISVEILEESIILKNGKKKLNNNTINLESRRYIGNKTKLMDWIMETILAQTQNCTSFFDVFAGTASVGKRAFQHFDRVILNDILKAKYNF